MGWCSLFAAVVAEENGAAFCRAGGRSLQGSGVKLKWRKHSFQFPFSEVWVDICLVPLFRTCREADCPSREWLAEGILTSLTLRSVGTKEVI